MMFCDIMVGQLTQKLNLKDYTYSIACEVDCGYDGLDNVFEVDCGLYDVFVTKIITQTS